MCVQSNTRDDEDDHNDAEDEDEYEGNDEDRLINLLAIGMRTRPYCASVAASYIVTGTTVMFWRKTCPSELCEQIQT